MTGNLGDGTTRTYSDSPSYSAKGQLTQQRFGTTTALWQNLRYNVRGQLYDARVGSEDQTWGWDRGCWQWYFGGAAWGQSSTTNNGNVTSTKVLKQVNGNPAAEDWSFTTTFGYDALNRLTSATENKTDSSGTAGTYSQSFTYDRWGNRNAFVVNGITLTPSSATNRLSASNSGISYDAAGNQTNDTATGGGARVFDAENRMMTAAALSGGTCVYVYDADGKRVKRNVGLSDETWMIYNLDGELAVEYQPNASQGSPKKEYGYRAGQMLVSADSTDCKWLVLDHLGSTRAVIGKSGSLADTKRRDFKPFGEELAAGTNGRTTGMAYEGVATSTGPREKFATYERDEDTGLDFAQERYFSATTSRFIAYDPLRSSAKESSPQTWNRYTYSNNSPLVFFDKSGLDAQKKEEQKKEEQKPKPKDPPKVTVTQFKKDPQLTQARIVSSVPKVINGEIRENKDGKQEVAYGFKVDLVYTLEFGKEVKPDSGSPVTVTEVVTGTSDDKETPEFKLTVDAVQTGNNKYSFKDEIGSTNPDPSGPISERVSTQRIYVNAIFDGKMRSVLIRQNEIQVSPQNNSISIKEVEAKEP